MSQKPISELRRRMLGDMAVRNFSEATIRNYIRHIADLAKFLGRSPDTATAEDVRGLFALPRYYGINCQQIQPVGRA